MILGTDKVLELIKSKKLIERFSEKELSSHTGIGVDLRIGKLYAVGGCSLIGRENRKTLSTRLVTDAQREGVCLKSDSFYLMETIEKINMPDNLVALFTPRSSMLRSGLMVYTATCDPGYSGTLTFAIKNIGGCDARIEIGARVANVMFYEIDGDVRLYNGTWQGGRVSTN